MIKRLPVMQKKKKREKSWVSRASETLFIRESKRKGDKKKSSAGNVETDKLRPDKKQVAPVHRNTHQSW